MKWNVRGDARRDWSNVAHVLETLSQHGGAEALDQFLNTAKSKRSQNDFLAAARNVYGKMRITGREDLREDNW